MAETSMSLDELVRKLMGDDHADVLRESLAWFVRELMEAEVTQQIGAGLNEKVPERTAPRNGYRERAWQTRAGEIELAIPRLRSGSYFPSFLEPRSRSEKALVAVVQEAYVNGVSTRKVDRLVSQLGLAGISKSAVSRLCAGLDEQVRCFRERPLEGAYPYLWLDAKVERVREPGGVRHKALVIAYGVHETGRREVIGIDVGEGETEAFWREFLRSLRARGLSGVQLCVSDAHEGLKGAIAKVLSSPWQRCTVHFLRDMLGHCGRAQQPMIAAAIRQIFAAESGEEARERLAGMATALARLLAAAEEELLAFMAFPKEHWSKLRSTNPLERVNLRWSDVDLETGRLAVRRALIPIGRDVIVSEPKTVKGRRVIALDPGTVEVLKAEAARQLEEQREWDDAWVETDLVFTRENGAALDPETVTRHFRQAVRKSMLPLIRLHDLRHTHATLALQAGIHPKVVSERLDHATISITLDTYSHAIPAMQEEAAALIAGLVFAAR